MENKILNALLERDYSFNELFQCLSCNRNSLLKNLNKLLAKKLIHLTPEGQKHWYSLTEKGQEKAARLACDNINQGLKSLKLLSSNLNPKKVKDRFNAELDAVDWDSIKKRDEEENNKKLDEEWKEWIKLDEELKELNGKPVIDGGKRLKIIKVMMESHEFNIQIFEDKKTFGQPLFFPIDEAPVVKALSDICQSLHKIRCGIYTNNSDGKDYVTTITSNGVYLFPEKNLEGLNLDLLTMFPLSKARNIPYRPSK